MPSTTDRIARTPEATRAAEQAFHYATLRAADDSLDLRYATYTQDGDEPEQYVVFMNGRSEWIEKYAYVAHDLQLPPRTGFLTWDHRGQGASGGTRSYVDDYADFTSDALQIITAVTKGKPYVLMAHSMGGLIGLYGALQGSLHPKAMVLCSPLLGLPNKPLPCKVSRPLSRTLTFCGLGGLSTGGGNYDTTPFAANVVTHDVGRYERILNSPYKIPPATVGWVKASFAATDVCFDAEKLRSFNIPTLVLGGSREEVVDPNCFRDWTSTATQLSPADVQLLVLPGAKHELLSEIPSYYDQTILAARNWFKPHLR